MLFITGARLENSFEHIAVPHNNLKPSLKHFMTAVNMPKGSITGGLMLSPYNLCSSVKAVMCETAVSEV